MTTVALPDEPELSLVKLLQAMPLGDWIHLNSMFTVIDEARESGRPISKYKTIARRLGMTEPTFTKFRRRVGMAMKAILPSGEELLDAELFLTQTGDRAWELADWVDRVINSTKF